MALGAPKDAFHLLRPRNTLLFVASFSLLVGWRTHNPALVMLGATLTAFLLAAAGSVPLLFRNIRAQRFHDLRAFQGDDVAAELRLQSRAALGAFLVEIVDSFPPAGPQFVRALFPGLWRKGHEIALRFRKPCVRHRGVYVLGPLRVSASDPLGLFERESLLPLFTTLHVYPQAPELLQFDVLGDGTRPHAGIETVREAGRSEEFIGLREYRHGDPPRLIHWPTSAHHNRLLVKDFQDERTTDVSIVLHLSRLGLTGLGEQTTAEYGIMCAASVARVAFEKSHAFQLFALSGTVDHVPLGGGVQHLLTLLDCLLHLKPEGERSLADELVAQRPFLRPGSTLVLIASAATLDLARVGPLLEHLGEDHIKRIVLLLDDRSFPKLYREQERLHQEAVALDEAVFQLRLMGARVHVLRRGHDPAQSIRSSLAVESHLQA